MANYDPNSQEILGLQEQKALAKALMEHGMSQNLQGQMVSGRYVGASPWEGVAKLANIYVGSKLREQAGQKELDLAEMLRTKGAEATQDYIKALQGTPEQVYEQQAGPTPTGGNIPVQPPTPATGPDYGAAFRAATSRYAPAALQSAGYELLKPIKTAEGETVTQHNFAPGGGFTTLATGGEKNPNEIKSAVAILGLPKDSSKWTAEDRLAIDAQVLKMKRANANQNTVNMPPAESAYSIEMGKGAAKQDLALKDIADSAQDVLNNVIRQKQILKSEKVITGFGAEPRLALAQFGQAIGAGGKNADELVANTQALLAGRASATLDAIKTSNLGSAQGFSNTDRDFLEKAKLGGIKYTSQSLNQQLDIEAKIARMGVDKYNKRLQSMPKNASNPINLSPIKLSNDDPLGIR
jgi:hypothetical protein